MWILSCDWSSWAPHTKNTQNVIKRDASNWRSHSSVSSLDRVSLIENSSRFSYLTWTWGQVVKWPDYHPFTDAETEGTEIPLLHKCLLSIHYMSSTERLVWLLDQYSCGSETFELSLVPYHRIGGGSESSAVPLPIQAKANAHQIRAMSWVTRQLTKGSDKEVADTHTPPNCNKVFLVI